MSYGEGGEGEVDGGMGPGHPDWPTKPDGTPLSRAAGEAVLRGRGVKVAPAQGRTRADGPGELYVEVKERIQKFYATYETGALVTRRVQVEMVGDAEYITVHALAYRTPDDPHPGTGTSWMKVPGTTPYTRGSELENAETSAWGRAMAAVGILVDRGIASASEIRAKGEGAEQPSSVPTTNADALREAAQAAAVEVVGSAGGVEDQGKDTAAIAAVVPTAVAVAPEARPQTETTAEPAEAPAGQSAPAEVSQVKEEAAGKAPLQSGLSYDEFKHLAREKFIPNGHIATTARDMVEKGQLRQVGSVKDMTDDERFSLFLAAQATME